eukprot:scaffold78641_cov74-Phaeocystis_antarctica.AAC.3
MTAGGERGQYVTRILEELIDIRVDEQRVGGERCQVCVDQLLLVDGRVLGHHAHSTQNVDAARRQQRTGCV